MKAKLLGSHSIERFFSSCTVIQTMPLLICSDFISMIKAFLTTKLHQYNSLLISLSRSFKIQHYIGSLVLSYPNHIIPILLFTRQAIDLLLPFYLEKILFSLLRSNLYEISVNITITQENNSIKKLSDLKCPSWFL